MVTYKIEKDLLRTTKQEFKRNGKTLKSTANLRAVTKGKLKKQNCANFKTYKLKNVHPKSKRHLTPS